MGTDRPPVPLHSSINLSRARHDLIAPSKLSNVIDAKRNDENQRYNRRESITKFRSIVSQHNMNADYQAVATANAVA